jgi:hypothetical protein
VSLNVNQEEYFLRVIIDTDASNMMILETHASENISRNDERNKNQHKILLQNYEYLFDGTLEGINMDRIPVSL